MASKSMATITVPQPATDPAPCAASVAWGQDGDAEAANAAPQHQSTLLPQIPATPMEPEDVRDSDSDSAFSSEVSSSYTTSIGSSIWDYQYENGRRYHAFRAGQYVIPNDEKEQDRLDFMHHIFNMTLQGKLFNSPLEGSPQKILDIGTGTGIWAIDVADLFPSAEVIGLDLSPIQPQWVPPNLSFQIDDIESEWTFPPNAPFDLIHARAMGGSIASWSNLLDQAYKHIKPGGWIEVTDFEAWGSTDDDSLPETSAYHEYQLRLDEASSKIGRKMNIAPAHKQALQDAGFEGVVDNVTKVPLSPWARDPKLKDFGRYMQIQMIDAVESYGIALLTRVLGWTPTRAHVLIAGVRQDLRNRNYHLYSRCHSVYGRKPLR